MCRIENGLKATKAIIFNRQINDVNFAVTKGSGYNSTFALFSTTTPNECLRTIKQKPFTRPIHENN